MSDIYAYTRFVKQEALRLGFDAVGIAKPQQLDAEARKLEEWISKGMNANLKYMENHFEMRVDPRKLVPGVKSIITVLKNYYPSAFQKNNNPKIAKFAYSKDYHKVIKKMLKQFLYNIREKFGDIHGRGFVDSAPILEKAWAAKSGLGWIGKSGNFITKEKGTYCFIATLFVDLELLADQPYVENFCGSCTRCIDACPTQAITNVHLVDANKCIAYNTIELRKQPIPEKFKGKFGTSIFGCDICQDVCPWNRFKKPHNEIEFQPINEILNYTLNDWLNLDEEKFNLLFKATPLKRQGFEGIVRNIKFVFGEGK